VQVPSATRLEMALPQITQETLPGDQLIMSNNGLLSSRYASGCRVGTQAPRGHITPATYAGAIPEKQVENLVAGFLGSLERPPAVKR
jgi:hypothetical protein